MTTSVLRVRIRAPPADSRAPSFSESCTFPRTASSAGAKPKISPAKTEIPKLNACTGPLSEISSRRGMCGGLSNFSAATPQRAKSSPSAQPNSASSTLSVRSCRRIRVRPAPSAHRIPISRWRTDARPSSRFATFAHTITRTNPTAPRRASSVGRTGPAISSCSGTTFTVWPAFVVGYISVKCRAIVFISACARAVVTPAFNRATMSK